MRKIITLLSCLGCLQLSAQITTYNILSSDQMNFHYFGERYLVLNHFRNDVNDPIPSTHFLVRVTIEDRYNTHNNVIMHHTQGFAVATAYPNPGKDLLNIRTGLKDARVEVYDMSGRMVYGQEIIDNVTAINTSAWSAGGVCLESDG